MIKNDKIEIIVYNKEIKHYKQFFQNVKQGDKIIIDIYMLKSQSKKEIDVQCDICGKDKIIDYCTYRKITNEFKDKYYCKKCKWIKTKETNLKRYGSENVFQNEQIKNKIKETNIEKYGVEYPIKNEERKQKRKDAEVEKYGFDHQSKNLEIKEKLDPWELATEDEKLKLRNNCRMVSEIEKCVSYHRYNKKFEIPINQIHSFLTSKTPMASVEKIALRNCTLKLCSDKSKYLISTNK